MKIDRDLAELLGIHIGDGCISENKRYSEYYLGGDIKEEKEYHNNWVGPLFNKKIMKPLFNREVNYKEHPKVGIYGFYIFNKKLVDFFKDLGIPSGSKINVKIPKQIMENKNLLKRFLRGLFDTDGNIYFQKNYSAKKPINKQPIIKIGTVSKFLAKNTFESLISLGLNPRMKNRRKGKRDKNYVYTVVIYRKNDIDYFIKNIGFKNPKHMTKWEMVKKLGYYVPNTTLFQRKKILGNSKTL